LDRRVLYNFFLQRNILNFLQNNILTIQNVYELIISNEDANGS